MKKLLFALCATLMIVSCQDFNDGNQAQKPEPKISITIPEVLTNYQTAARRAGTVDIKTTLNNTLFAGSNIQVKDVHTFKTIDAVTTVETVDQQFQSTLTSRWVPGDVNRDWNGDGDLDDIDWVSFYPFAVANELYDAEPIYRSMYSKWQNDGYCNTVKIDEMPYDFAMGNPSLILDFGLPSTGNPIADISVVGFLPASIFEAVLGAENILGVAFSFVFVDDNGDPIKSTRGKEDKAYTEVWFNDGFTWAEGAGLGVIDLESVILHEFGHTLNLGHFGVLQVLTDTETGATDYVYQPVNTMNALYIGEARNFLGPNDKGNYCEAWGGWPWN
ncbi:hypothetical protein N6H18_18180 [Reichenbachiella agarivorans]|uniref:Peptidase M10 metallopeptidase domain-containing protein n=1 Tax=Reichenbachiella agarivorans TaxID=2979464 RepID=A0ABY6CP30_9BACT|nr:hypothetical protein [Reichenbachiella agarivorans]UXP32270.1 hypothetical protein N6H18_18180 [Reichenbachiella agarivorans]